VERGLFIAAAGMLADQLRQDVIANNLANATTPGYKGDRAVGEEFNSLLLNNLQTGAPVGQLGTGARIADVVTDGSQGALRHTDNTFDLAISGDGYFAVQSAAGTRYTRDGAFTLDNRGQLSTSKGEPVLGADGRPVVVPSGGKATIDQGGRVFVNERQVATIGVTARPRGAGLPRAGERLERPRDGRPDQRHALVRVVAEGLERARRDARQGRQRDREGVTVPDGLWAAATGMLGQQTAMDAIANNLANVNTTGYKRGRTAFQDLLYRELSPQEAAKQGAQVGVGVRVSAIQAQFEQGPLQETKNELDLAIEGEGFFEVSRPDGSKAYTRAGELTVDANGTLVTASGDALSPKITVPGGAKDIKIGADGLVTATVSGASRQLGRIQLATFANPYGLQSIGSNEYAATSNSGTARVGNANAAGAGAIHQGALEGSNVNAVDEMVGMVTTQRAYEAVAKVVSASDEMLQMANQLRRS
jgi:flagellar basal-body rod protein FlgG